MDTAFYLAAAIAVAATLMVVTRLDAVHALLYLIVSLLAVAVVFFLLGAPFAAALEVVIYAGAIVVLFVFVVMMLNLGREAATQEQRWLKPGIWIGPALLSALLLAELLVVLWRLPAGSGQAAVTPEQVGAALFGPYLLAVELASMLLLAALVGAFHIGRHRPGEGREEDAADGDGN
jgi:NADH-quinone oxidoreductase subunit J